MSICEASTTQPVDSRSVLFGLRDRLDQIIKSNSVRIEKHRRDHEICSAALESGSISQMLSVRRELFGVEPD
jgi:hypothetical protein